MSDNLLDRLAIGNFNYRRWSFDYFLDSVKRLGLKNIQLCGCHPHFTMFEAEEFPTKELAAKIKAAGLKVPVIEPEQNFLPLNIAASGEYLREQSIKQIEFFIERAGEFDCDKVTLWPGKAFVNHPHSEGWKNARESVARLCDTAEKYGVTLLMTPVSEFVSDLMKDSETVARMLREVDKPNLKVCLNGSIVGYVGETLDDYFEKFGDKIELVQLSDAVEDCDQMAWGEGDLDLDAQLTSLKKYNYEGPVTMQLLMEEYAEDPHAAHEASLNYMKAHM